MKLEGISTRNGGGSDRWALYADYRRSMQPDAPDAGTLAAGGTQESPETKRPNSSTESPEAKRTPDSTQCQTCQSRRYQDGSDDPGVSFKTPTQLSPEQAASAVRGHEMEHVSRETSKASREDRKVISQSVTYQNAICPECGRVYVAGGTTRTVTKGQTEAPEPEAAQTAPRKGSFEAFV